MLARNRHLVSKQGIPVNPRRKHTGSPQNDWRVADELFPQFQASLVKPGRHTSRLFTYQKVYWRSSEVV